jgi:hypothetical protein
MLSLNPQYLLLLFALILFCAANAASQIITIEGRVRTPEGEPISDVRIDRLAKTDATGHFKIAADFLRYWNTLWIDKRGFVPKIISISPTPSNLDITLEPEKDTSVLDIPRCSDAKVKDSRFVGKFLRLTVPKELKFKTGVDTDYIYYHIGYAKNGKTGWLRGGLGNVYGDAYPPGEMLLAL